MSKYRAGDKVRVTKLLTFDEANGIEKGGIYEVTMADDRVEGVSVNTHIRNNYGLIYNQIEKVEEEKQVNKFKVGDKVLVKWVDEEDTCRDVSKGDCFEVLRVDSDGDILVALPNGEKGVLFKGQLEKVDGEEQVNEFKVGDRVRVISLHSRKDERYLRVGKTYRVYSVDNDGWPLIITHGEIHQMMPSQVEKVEDNEFAFPQMAQKLIDGEFEIGTELVTNDKSYFVDRVSYSRNYGLKTSEHGVFVTSEISASDFNATWKVKEQTVKEMSIEEIQRELGYKIKVTE